MADKKGVRALLVFVALVLVLVISGCSNCEYEEVKFFVDNPVERLVQETRKEVRTFEEPVYTKECNSVLKSSILEGKDFAIRLGEKRWEEAPVIGEGNKLVQTVYLKNLHDEVESYFVDIIYLKASEIVERSKRSLLHVVDPQSEKRLFVSWSTDYDPEKDVRLEVVDKEAENATVCITKKKMVKKAGVIDVVYNNTEVDYQREVKTKSVKSCR